MDAKAKPIEEILHSGHQFLVPFFQRNYSWKRENWERLRNDIWSLMEETDRKKHFLGPLVCAGMQPIPGEVNKLQLIDGQQRLSAVRYSTLPRIPVMRPRSGTKHSPIMTSLQLSPATSTTGVLAYHER